MLAQKLFVSYSSRILTQFFTIFTTIIIARIVGPEILGMVAYGLAFCGMFKMIAELGIGTTHMKFLSEGRDQEKCIGTYVVLKMILIGVFSLTVSSVYLIPRLLQANYIFTTQDHIVLLSIVIMTIEHLWTIPKVTFAAYTEQAKQDIPDVINSISTQILRLIVVILGYRAIALVLSNLTTDILVSFIYLYLFKKYPIGKFDRKLAKEYMGTTSIILLMMIGQTVVAQTDIVLLKYFSNVEQVGYYSAGMRLSIFIKIIGQSVSMLFFPMFSKFIVEKNYKQINLLIDKYNRFSIMFILPILILFAIHADIVVKLLLGNKFMPSAPLISISFISSFIYLLTIPYGNILSGNGSFKLLTKIYFALALVCLPSLFLIKELFPGINVAILISCYMLAYNFLLGISFLIFSRKLSTEIILFQSRNLLLVIVIWGILAAIIQMFIPFVLLKIAVSIIIIVLLYLFLAKTKMIKLEEYHALLKMINFKRNIKYVKTEMFKK